MRWFMKRTIETNNKGKNEIIYQIFKIKNQDRRRDVAQRAHKKAQLKNAEGYKGVKYVVQDLGDKFVVVAELDTER